MKTNLNVELRRLIKQRIAKEVNPLAFRDLTVSSLGSFFTNGKILTPRSIERGAGFIYDLVTKVRADKGRVRIPLVDDTASQWFLSSAVGESVDIFGDAIDFEFDSQQTSAIRIANSLIEDCSDFDLVSYVNSRIERQYLRSMCQIITKGNGSGVKGLVEDATTFAQSVTTSNTAVSYSDLTNAVEALDSGYYANSAWAMNVNTLNKVRNINDTANRPVFIDYEDPTGKSGFAGQILGIPVKINPSLDKVGPGNVAIQLGDFANGYTLAEIMPHDLANQVQDQTYPYAMRLVTETYAGYNQIAVFGVNRVAGSPTVANKSYSPVINVFKA